MSMENPLSSAGSGAGGGGGSSITSISAGPGVEVTNGSGPVVTVGTTAAMRTDSIGHVQVDAAASSATAERSIHINRSGVDQTVASVNMVNATTLAGHDTNNFTLNIFRRNAAGTQATIVTYTNNVASGGLTAWILKDLGALANTTIADGESISYSVTKGGSGQALVLRIEVKLTIAG